MVIVDKQKSRIDLPVVSSPYQKLSVEFCCFPPLDVHRTSDGRPSKYNIIGIRGESKGFLNTKFSPWIC